MCRWVENLKYRRDQIAFVITFGEFSRDYESKAVSGSNPQYPSMLQRLRPYILCAMFNPLYWKEPRVRAYYRVQFYKKPTLRLGDLH